MPDPAQLDSGATKSPDCIISIIGSHASETLSTIFARKKQEIADDGKAFWLIQSHKATTKQVQRLGQITKPEERIPVLFIDAAQTGGAKPTLHQEQASHYSIDGQIWERIPMGIRVTGNITKKSTALVLSELHVLEHPIPIDLWEYSEFDTESPIKFALGSSTVCAIRKPSIGMKSKFRNAVAYGKLTSPFGVWLKAE